MNLLKKFHRGEEGMESIQVIMILAAAAVIITGVALVWSQEGSGTVTIRDLVRNALRMRPDRVVIGECRGGEAVDMLQAMNTGHDGSLTTIHANSPDGVIRRLEVLVQQNADTRLPVETIHRQIASAVDLIVQLGVQGEGAQKRKVVTEIAEVMEVEEGGVRIVPLFRGREGGQLRPTGRLPSFLPELIAAGLVADPVEFVRAVEGWVAPHSTVERQGRPEREQFLHRPGMVGPASRPSWRSL